MNASPRPAGERRWLRPALGALILLASYAGLQCARAETASASALPAETGGLAADIKRLESSLRLIRALPDLGPK